MDNAPAIENDTGPADRHDEPVRAPAPAAATLDLDGIERDLADVEVALARLDAGTYWIDEVTGQPLDEGHLADHPAARRAAG
jgi:RNA polymerase-binding transcription factor DksA